MQETKETLVSSLDGEDFLEQGTATHSSVLAWRIPWTEEPGGLQSMGLQRVGHNCVTKQSTEKFWTSTLHAGILGEATSEQEGVRGLSVEEWVTKRTGGIAGGDHPCVASVSSFWGKDTF